MKERLPVQWACAVIGSENYRTLEAHYQKNALIRFTLISAALISQILGLLLVTFIGIVIGSVVLGLLG